MVLLIFSPWFTPRRAACCSRTADSVAICVGPMLHMVHTTAAIVGSCSVAVLVTTFGALGVLLAQLDDSVTRGLLRKWADLTEGFASGVLLSLALLHILVKAQAELALQSRFPVANAGLLAGFFLMALAHLLAPKRLLSHDGANKLTFYLVEASIALHSMMIGLAVGFSQQQGWKQLVSLGVALCAHQFLEGYILSTLAKRTLRQREVWRVCLIFTLTLPLGVVIANIAQSAWKRGDDLEDDDGYRWTVGILNAVAAGTLTQLGAEMISGHDHELTSPHDPVQLVSSDPEERQSMLPCSGPEESLAFQPLPKLLMFAVGAMGMAFLAIWDGDEMR